MLDASGTHAPLLLVRLPEMPEWSDEDPLAVGLYLVRAVPGSRERRPQSIRSAAAFGAARVVLLRESAHPFHPKAARAAGPASCFRSPLLHGPSIQDLTSDRVPLIALATDGPEPVRHRSPSRSAWSRGSKAPPARFTVKVSDVGSAMAPGVESLNAATATAVAPLRLAAEFVPDPHPHPRPRAGSGG